MAPPKLFKRAPKPQKIGGRKKPPGPGGKASRPKVFKQTKTKFWAKGAPKIFLSPKNFLIER